MRFRDPVREMTEGETNRVVFNLAPVAGSNTISGTPTLSADGLTFTGTSISGTTLTSKVSGGAAGTDYLVTVTAALSSGETKVGTVKLEWKRPGYDDRRAC
jgi:hypothetical protein